MRPGQNKRMRGRSNNGNNNNNRKGPNPLTRSYESNGPDVKIRGTAHHVGEKYLQLARDAQSSGDPVMAESYLQHAEHYFRLIASAQLAQQQAAYGYQRPAGEQVEEEDGDDDDFGNLPDRFASPSERAPVAPVQPAQPYNGGDRQPYEARAERYDRSNHQQPNFDRPQNERQGQQDRSQDRGSDRPQDRAYDNRNGRGDRNGYQQRDRAYQAPQQDRAAQQQGSQDRAPQQERAPQQDRAPQERSQERTPDRPYEQRPARDYDNRGFRNRGPRENGATSRDQRQPTVEEPTNGLPAFITAPTRIPADIASEREPEPATIETAPSSEVADDPGFHLRPRRRRRPKADLVDSGTDQHEAPANDPVGE